jgi:hypothetical protein
VGRLRFIHEDFSFNRQLRVTSNRVRRFALLVIDPSSFPPFSFFAADER